MDILSLVKKEKQVIMNDMKHMLKQIAKYKALYQQLLTEYDDLKHENGDLLDQSHAHHHTMADTYAKMIAILNSMHLDYHHLLPELGNPYQIPDH